MTGASASRRRVEEVPRPFISFAVPPASFGVNSIGDPEGQSIFAFVHPE
jgi:hypothetical protein